MHHRMKNHQKINRPIIIHGPGRSGTTLLSNILSLHPDFYWISGYVDRFPRLEILSCLNILQRFPAIERYNRSLRKFPRPAEAYGFWKYYFPKFNQAHSVPTAQQVHQALRSLHRIQRFSNGKRFITKITGAARIAYLEALFDDPIILWIDRQPEAVVMSFFKQKWHYKSRIQQYHEKPKKELIREYSNYYLSLMEEKEKLKQFSFYQLYYEDMIQEPDMFFKSLSDELDITFDKALKNIVGSWDIQKNNNQAYKKQLNGDEEGLLAELLAEPKRQMGYQ